MGQRQMHAIQSNQSTCYCAVYVQMPYHNSKICRVPIFTFQSTNTLRLFMYVMLHTDQIVLHIMNYHETVVKATKTNTLVIPS